MRRSMTWKLVLVALLALGAWSAAALAQGPPPDDDVEAGDDLFAMHDGPGPGFGPGMGMGPGPGQGPGMGRGRGAGFGPGFRHGRGPGAGLRAHFRELGVTDQQKDRLEAIHEAQRRRAIEIRKDLQLAELDVRKLVRADTPDRRAIDAQVDRVAALRTELQKSRLNAMLDARGVLTPQQRQKLEQLREQGPDGGAEDRPAPRGPNRQGGTRGQ